MVDSTAEQFGDQLEELDASFHPIEPAYVLVYRAERDGCKKHSGTKLLSCIKAELGERFSRLIFGSKQEFVRAVTTLVDSLGDEQLQAIDVPGCAVFARPPGMEAAKKVFMQNRTIFRHFAPVLWSEPGVHLLFEQPLFRIQCGGGLVRSGSHQSVQDPPDMLKALEKLGNSSGNSSDSLFQSAAVDCLSIQAYLDQRERIDANSHREKARRQKGRGNSDMFSTCAEFESASESGEYGELAKDHAGDRFSEKFKVSPSKLGGPNGQNNEDQRADFQLDKMQTGNGLFLCQPVIKGLEQIVWVPVQDGSWCRFLSKLMQEGNLRWRGYNPKMQRLVYKGEVLGDKMRIKECKIQEDSTLVLWLVLANGQIKQVPLG
ncbi:hypothetical protein BSKO_10965 [Bryopsis sp. KO-2023]|nr:hypothetical protein BSKO_10965 [Bryopsis sp. KO-2023]